MHYGFKPHTVGTDSALLLSKRFCCRFRVSSLCHFDAVAGHSSSPVGPLTPPSDGNTTSIRWRWYSLHIEVAFPSDGGGIPFIQRWYPLQMEVVFPSDGGGIPCIWRWHSHQMWYSPLMRVLRSLSEELDLDDVMDIELDFPTLPGAPSSTSSSLLPVPSLEVRDGFYLWITLKVYISLAGITFFEHLSFKLFILQKNFCGIPKNEVYTVLSM